MCSTALGVKGESEGESCELERARSFGWELSLGVGDVGERERAAKGKQGHTRLRLHTRDSSQAGRTDQQRNGPSEVGTHHQDDHQGERPPRNHHGDHHGDHHHNPTLVLTLPSHLP